MDESEFALQDAKDSPRQRLARIANSITEDSRTYRLWESRHADLLLPVAAHGNKKRQIFALRDTEIKLVHRRAFFDFLRTSETRGEERRRLFRILHSNMDYDAAVLAEHRHYMLAVSSHISAKHLVKVMNDPTSTALLRKYEKVYAAYFEMKCYVAGTGDSDCIELVRSAMGDVRDQLQKIRQQIESAPPEAGCGSFDRQELLARSGRYPVLNYMVG
jgi:hypothetical protein